MTLLGLRFFWTALVLVLVLSLHVNPSEAQGEEVCLDKFSLGKEDFVLQTNESVMEGATFLGSPPVSRPEACVMACCRDPDCNLALMEEAQEPKTIKACFIFNCLYKQKRVCRFVRKTGFRNYVSTSVFEDYLEQKVSNYLEQQVPDEEDKPPVAITGQDRVVQPHDDVTLNGVESRDDKKIVKYDWTMMSGDPSVVMSKSPNFVDAVTISNLSPGMFKFQLTVTDDAGQTDSAEVSVLVLTPEQSLHHCLVPKKEGPCRGSFIRWHYNAASEKCEQFKYGGCRPNHNNYLTLEECNNACDKVSVNAPSPSGRLGPIHNDKEQCDVACGPAHFSCSNNCCISEDLECDGEAQCSDESDETQCLNLNNKFIRLLDIPVDKSKAHCIDAPVTGVCRASFTYWYYNPYERRCHRFNYGGCDGNGNRFETEEQCMSSCSSVTGFVLWRMTLLGLRFFWTALVLVLVLSLHVNPSEAQGEEVCLDKFSLGKEDFVLQTNESVMEGATFLGSPPVSRPEACVMACCRDPDCNLALMEEAQEPKTIKACFIFNCLYKQKRVCRFVRKTGFRNYVSTSVFEDYLEQKVSNYLEQQVPDEEDKPPVAITGQDRVVQPHDDVTLNGVESRDDKKIVKYDWTMMSGDPSVVMSKSPNFVDAVTISNLSPGMFKFQLTVTDDAGQTDSAEVSVLVLTPEQSLHHCLVPKKEGPCRGSFIRWHYNAASEKCEQFKYGGCRPNHNNYLTLEECNNACDKVSVNAPSPSGRLGPIHNDKEQCDVACGPAHFSCSNNCCISEDLECDGEAQCSDESDETQCLNLNNKFIRLLDIPVDKSKAHCIDAPVTGVCRASFTYWYYNPYERRCHRFNYGGCDGNGNRFETEEQCMSSCSSVTESDVFERKAAFERLENKDDTVIIAIAVLLGIGIAILLIVIACCLLKGKKKRRNKHQQVAVNGGHVRMYEDSEKLVYNSTTKPI